MRPATKASSSASAPCTPAHTTSTSSPCPRAARRRRPGSGATPRAPLAASRGRHDRARPVRRRQDEAAVPGLEVLARRVAEIESRNEDVLPLAAEDAAPSSSRSANASSTSAAQSTRSYPDCERLADRRRRPDHVDDDPGRRPARLIRCQRDMDTHRGTLTRLGRAPPLLSASRPRDVRLVLGLRPRDLPGLHDVRPGRHPLPGSRGRRRGDAPAPTRAARSATRSLERYGPFITFTLIGMNVGVFLLELLLGGEHQRHRQLDLRERRALRPDRRRRRVVAPRHRAVPPLRAAAPRDEHARPLVHRPRARELPRALALPAPLRRRRGSPGPPARSSGRRTPSPSAPPERSGGSWARRSSSSGAGSTCSAGRRSGSSS